MSFVRAPRQTTNLKIPIPGDDGAADYVTATGAMMDHLDRELFQADAYAQFETSGMPYVNTPTGIALQFVWGETSVPGHTWFDAGQGIRLPLDGNYLIVAGVDFQTAITPTASCCVQIRAPVETGSIYTQQSAAGQWPASMSMSLIGQLAAGRHVGLSAGHSGGSAVQVWGYVHITLIQQRVWD